MFQSHLLWRIGCVKIPAVILVACLFGCQGSEPPASSIDAEWHRRSAVDDHLARVLAAAPTGSGAFYDTFTRTWEPERKNSFGATTHGRILYALATGYDITRNEAYVTELKRGADFMLAHMIDPDNGGVFESVAADGKPVNTVKRLYSQAFAIFGLAHAYRITRDERYRIAARSVWDRVRLLMRDGSGGFVAQSDRLFAKHGTARSQNPIMHLFEALLAMHDATSDPEWLRHARDIADFVLTRLMQKPSEDHRSIPEFYEADWKPQPSGRGGYIDLGHQAEWAWLLSAAAERGLPAYYADIGAKLLDYAIAVGYDRNRGGLYWRVNDKGSVTRTKIWWVQSEFLRAALRYGVAHGRTELRALYDQTLGYVRAEFLDNEHGGWTPQPKSQCAKDACKHQADVGYHVVGMHVDALHLSGMQARRH